MGWHLNKGPDQLADFYPASQFRKTLYRPDVIRRILQTGSVDRALEIADREAGRATQKTDVAQVLPPQVKITAPAAGETAAAEITVTAQAESVGEHPVTALRLLVDGRPYEGQKAIRRIESPKLGEAQADWSVVLTPGRHTLKVLADSAASQGVSDELEISYTAPDSKDEVQLPNLYVLAAGISKYPIDDLKLYYAASDAQAFAGSFETHSKPLFGKIEVRLLTDEKATRKDLLEGLVWLRKEMTQRDVGLFFFSGHGDKDADGNLYFLPVDVNPDILLATAVSADQVSTSLKGLPGRVMAFFDACHSGGLDPNRRKAAGSLTDDLVRDLVTDESGLIVMCSSTGREFSVESNAHRSGVFTLAITEGLSGKADSNRDGAVYLNELDNYTTDRVKELTKGQQHPVTAKPTTIRSFPLAKSGG